jgi:DNA-binding NarL/FixJ family response regulator
MYHLPGMTGVDGEADAHATANAAPVPRTRRAIVVDELALVRLGLTTLVSGLDIIPEVEVVAETPSGREAAELLRGQEADLAVIGVPADMPLGEAIRRARAAADSVLLLALLGVGQIATVAAIVAAGADGVALRGARPDELREALGAVLGGGRYVASMLAPGLLGVLEPAQTPASPADGDLLTYREREVLALLAGGASNREIAVTLSVTLATVKSHLVHVYAKLAVRNRHEALSRAVALGLLA